MLCNFFFFLKGTHGIPKIDNLFSQPDQLFLDIKLAQVEQTVLQRRFSSWISVSCQQYRVFSGRSTTDRSQTLEQ